MCARSGTCPCALSSGPVHLPTLPRPPPSLFPADSAQARTIHPLLRTHTKSSERSYKLLNCFKTCKCFSQKLQNVHKPLELEKHVSNRSKHFLFGRCKIAAPQYSNRFIIKRLKNEGLIFSVKRYELYTKVQL